MHLVARNLLFRQNVLLDMFNKFLLQFFIAFMEFIIQLVE